ncbi:MAG TPA: DoxX family membrane protein [Candidatus Acidoferrum sp.]|nr:DoxX family membrane protein [Candidatus Acidoferrum sp.]
MRNGIIDECANRVDMSTAVKVVSWILRITAAIILLQTLYFKFTGAPESVYIFTKVHAEPWGRLGSGVMELVASILLLTPRYTWLGSLLAAAATAGAILSHLTLLGIEVQGDKGLLFALAIIVFLASAINLFLHRKQIPLVGDKLA